jgi:hypothetical protein
MELPTEDQRAATVAIEALSAAGLHDAAEGSYYDYAGMQRKSGEWEALFCSPRPEGRLTDFGLPLDCYPGAADSFITLSRDGSDVVVTGTSGSFLPEERQLLEGYRAPAQPPPAHWVYSVASATTPVGEALVVSSYWTGEIPSVLGAECRIEIVGETGTTLFERSFPALAPEDERGRDGSLFQEVPHRLILRDATVKCGRTLPVQMFPEGPHHVLASGIFETGPDTGEPWQLTVWRGEEVDDSRILALWKRHPEDVGYCWNLESKSFYNYDANGNRAAGGSCGVIDDKQDTIGSRLFNPAVEGGPAFAVGEVSQEVARLEFHMESGEVIAADLLEPPSNLGIPSNLYITFLPPDSNGEIVAYDPSGQVLARKTLHRG